MNSLFATLLCAIIFWSLVAALGIAITLYLCLRKILDILDRVLAPATRPKQPCPGHLGQGRTLEFASPAELDKFIRSLEQMDTGYKPTGVYMHESHESPASHTYQDSRASQTSQTFQPSQTCQASQSSQTEPASQSSQDFHGSANEHTAWPSPEDTDDGHYKKNW